MQEYKKLRLCDTSAIAMNKQSEGPMLDADVKEQKDEPQCQAEDAAESAVGSALGLVASDDDATEEFPPDPGFWWKQGKKQLWISTVAWIAETAKDDEEDACDDVDGHEIMTKVGIVVVAFLIQAGEISDILNRGGSIAGVVRKVAGIVLPIDE